MLLKSFLTWTGLSIGLLFSSMTMGHTRHFPRGTHDIFIAQTSTVRADILKNIAPIVEKSIYAGNYPGAVVLVSHRGKIIYRGVFGNRRILPSIAPMQFDTIFDIASLTKVVATTPAIMQLIEQNKLELDAPVAKYWPAFGIKDKNNITVRELLTHTSGLQADLDVAANDKHVLEKITKIKLLHSPGEKFIYSDINFIVLAHLVEIITHQSFDHYVQTHIFDILNMQHTRFLPPTKWRNQIAPTEIIEKKLYWGKVLDPMAQSLGGVAGNAGVFSTANDLGIYAQCLLNGGKYQKNEATKPVYLLGPLTILKMITPQTPANIKEVRGLGWDIDSPYENRGVLLPAQSFGHSGYTGTSLWIDPTTETWIIILTSRTHPTMSNHNQFM